MPKIYMDHSATTPVAGEVIAAITDALANNWGNPSSLHSYGNEARGALEKARSQVASLIGANSQEIIFTSGGTEADNLAIIGYAWAHRDKGRHLITSAIEHHAVLMLFNFWLTMVLR